MWGLDQAQVISLSQSSDGCCGLAASAGVGEGTVADPDVGDAGGPLGCWS